MEPDPLAAEILAEGVAQYALVVFRVSERISKTRRKEDALLTPELIHMSKRNIRVQFSHCKS